MTSNHPFQFLRAALVLLAMHGFLAAQTVRVSIDPTQDRVAISPYLYGKNNNTDSLQNPLRESDWQLIRDAGVRMLRQNGGNNGTKYNWQKKLSSHPDWYNNVYGNDWDYAQTAAQQHLPGVQVMWCFQLLGKVAGNTSNNFADWNYNRSQWWSGTGQNLAGGGIVNPNGGNKALTEGNVSLYLTDTSAAISTAILDHWIKPTGLGLDRNQFRYWNMDNEPEIWNGTHDDVMPTQLSAEAFMQRYFEYAKQARARFPEIKLVGPVTANEWQWYNWATPITGADGRRYCWLEYFIKRIGEEQARSGIRLLDVLDVHFYPGVTAPASIVQLHRIFFDTTYANPEANGVRAVNGGWDTSITQEYIFGRCQQWLDKHLGSGHGVTFGLTETDIPITNAPVASVWYASTLGEFMKRGVEILTPWSWQPGMWEVLHLYSRYNYATSVRADSDDETNVSAYASIDDNTGNSRVVLVNRALTASKSTSVSLANLALADGNYSTLQLANLPSTETFLSHTSNALVAGSVNVVGNQFTISLPPLSITSVHLQRTADVPPPPSAASRLSAVSVRAWSGTDENVLIVGFAIGGGGLKKTLIRGLGPKLASLDVNMTMVDPVLTLSNQAQGTLMVNDNWGSDAAQIASVSKSLGALDLVAGSLDAALVTELPGGGFSARFEDKSGGTGVVLGEVYDADLSSPSHFTAIAARAWVGTGTDNLIAGFVISGPSNKTLLIRGVGPGLTSLGVNGVLKDPVLRVYKIGDSRPLYQNDDWGTISYSDQIAAVAHSVGEFPLASDSKDAVLLVTLPQGIYSAVVSGANDTTGVAMVEVYEIQ